MNNLTATIFALAAGLALSGGAFAANMSKDEYKTAKDKIEADAKADKAACKSMSGNARDICQAEAKGKEKVAKAELEAQYKPSNKATTKVRNMKAEAEYEVAKEKCDDMKGNEKDVCRKDAKAAYTSAKADSKAQKRTTAARKDAAENKAEANYEAAKERCDKLSGAAKDKCVADAKARYPNR